MPRNKEQQKNIKVNTTIDPFGEYMDIINKYSISIEAIYLFLNDLNEHIDKNISLFQEQEEKNGKFLDPDNRYYFYEEFFGSQLRKSVIISLIIMLEKFIDDYCLFFKKHKKIPISYKELRGNLFDRYEIYFEKFLFCNVHFDEILWKDIKGLYEIRNCLVHNNGFITDNNKSKILEFSKKRKIFSVSKDSSIEVSQNDCKESIQIVYKFIEQSHTYVDHCFNNQVESDEQHPLKPNVKYF